jgi:hypothetical protein
VRRAAGSIELDLPSLPRGAAPIDVAASVGVGRIRVILPPDARVDVSLGVGKGLIEPLPYRRVQGFDRHWSRTYPPIGRRRASRLIRVDARVGLGEIDIQPPGTVLR